MGSLARSECLKKAGLDGGGGIGVLHPGFEALEGFSPGVGAARVGAGK